MKILITSFGPFQDFTENPSNEVMQLLKNRFDSNTNYGISISWETLEVSYTSVNEFENRISNNKYDLLLHLGVAANDPVMRIEVSARNECSGKDIMGNTPIKNCIIENGNNIPTNVQMNILQNFCNEYTGKVRISEDAGSYLCNYLYYNSLATQSFKSQVLFVHIADFKNNINAVLADEQSEIIYELLKNLINNTTINIA